MCFHFLYCVGLQLGIGLRSNAAAAQQLMDRDLLGTHRFAVVRDDFDQAQVAFGLVCAPRIKTRCIPPPSRTCLLPKKFEPNS
jgi:hypothetical protein